MVGKASGPSDRESIVDYSIKTPPDPKQTIKTDSHRTISKANSQSFVNNSQKTDQPSKEYPALQDRVYSENSTKLDKLSVASSQKPSKLSILEKIKQKLSSEKIQQKLRIAIPILLGVGALIAGTLLIPLTGGVSLVVGVAVAVVSYVNVTLVVMKQKKSNRDSVKINQVSNTENNKSTEGFDRKAGELNRIASKDALGDVPIANDDRTDVLNNIKANQDNNSTDQQSNSGTKYNDT